MPKKDFLEQFSTNNVPDSFKQEELKPVKKSINPTPFIILGIVLLVLLGVGIFLLIFLNRPTIEMPNFVGEKTSEVSSWAKQQEIEISGIRYSEEYNDEFDEKIIINQSVEEGTKIKKDTKIDFTVSLGPDPNASITVPDISSMNLDSIKTWIDDNKLRGVKLNYEFSDTDPLDSVISFVFGNGVSESNFIRTSSLTITISKGKQSDQAISVPNFVGKNVSEVETWGSKNKIKIVKKEEFSSTVQKDMVISQSVNVGKKITSKETLTVNVSRGEAIYAPDFSNYSEANIIAWGTKNLVNIEIIRKYSSSVDKDKVIEQSNKGEPVNDGMTVTISLGKVSLDGFTGLTLSDLEKWVEEVNKDGAGLHINIYAEDDMLNSDTVPVGQLFNLKLSGSSIKGNISKGRNILLDNTEKYKWENILGGEHYTEDQIRSLIEAQSAPLTVEYVYQKSDECGIGHVIKVVRDNNVVPEAGTYISQTETIFVYICEEIKNES